MRRLTEYVGKYPHGRPGKTYAEAIESTDVCRGEFEATACVERLAAYEDTGLEPDEIPRWIPVSERLPKENEYREADTRELIPLLVCVKGTKYSFRAFYDGKSWGDGWSKLDVLYWQPLPAAPKEVSKSKR